MNRSPLFFLPALLIIALALTACRGSSPSISGSSWTLVSYGDPAAPTPAVSGVDTSLKFGSDGQVSGSMGCNGFGGDYSVSGTSIKFGSLISTMMACDEPRMSQEQTAFGVMSGKTSFVMNGNILTITSSDGSKVLNLAKQ